MSNSFPNHGDLQGWADFLQAGGPVVLDSTQESLSGLKLKDEALLPTDLSTVILRDPLFAASLLGHLQANRNRLRNSDITTIEHALMMLGIEPFYRIFGSSPTLSEVIPTNKIALEASMKVARRSYVASRLAQDWAAKEKDTQSEELQVAALIHDVAEMLLWIRAPGHALLIGRKMRDDPTLRSARAQTEVLGLPLFDIALEIGKKWGLPQILLDLQAASAPTPRMRMVDLAVRLSRHSAHGWNNPALPDDWDDIAPLLGYPDGRSASEDIMPYIEAVLAKWNAANPILASARG